MTATNGEYCAVCEGYWGAEGTHRWRGVRYHAECAFKKLQAAHAKDAARIKALQTYVWAADRNKVMSTDADAGLLHPYNELEYKLVMHWGGKPSQRVLFEYTVQLMDSPAELFQ